jgi:hypothetical protein
MTEPGGPFDPAPDAGICADPACSRPTVVSSDRCRVHLTESLRQKGEQVLFDDPELSGLHAAALQIIRVALEGLPADTSDAPGPPGEIDMYALVAPDANWQLAQMSLDLLGTELSDLFGAMALSPPMSYESNVLLRLKVAVPAVEGFLPRMRFALEAMVREIIGPGAWALFSVAPAE